MAFRFSLAAVLRVRELTEEREERLLRQILTELAQTGEQLASNKRAIGAAWEKLGVQREAAIKGHQVQAAYGEVKELTRNQEEMEARLTKLEVLRDKQIVVYHAARRDREMLTAMQQEKRAEYDTEAARSEQKLLDDSHLARRLRRAEGD